MVPKQQLLPFALDLASQLPRKREDCRSYNVLHGTLLQIHRLLQEVTSFRDDPGNSKNTNAESANISQSEDDSATLWSRLEQANSTQATSVADAGNATAPENKDNTPEVATGSPQSESAHCTRLARVLFACSWLAESENSCHVVRASYLRLVLTVQEKTGVDFSEQLVGILNAELDALLSAKEDEKFRPTERQREIFSGDFVKPEADPDAAESPSGGESRDRGGKRSDVTAGRIDDVTSDVGVGLDQFLTQLLTWHLSMAMDTARSVAKLLRSNNWDIIVPCLQFKREYLSAKGTADKMADTLAVADWKEVQRSLGGLLLSDQTPWEPLCEAFECAIVIYDVTGNGMTSEENQKLTETDALWERMNTLQQRERNSRLAGYALVVMGMLVSDHMTSDDDDVTNSANRLLPFCYLLRSCSEPTCAEDLRNRCAQALKLFGAKVLKFLLSLQTLPQKNPHVDEALLNLVFATESLLVDENPDIRNATARFVSSVNMASQRRTASVIENEDVEKEATSSMRAEGQGLQPVTLETGNAGVTSAPIIATQSKCEGKISGKGEERNEESFGSAGICSKEQRTEPGLSACSVMHPNVALDSLVSWTKRCDQFVLVKLVLESFKSDESATAVITRETKMAVDDLFAPEEVNPYRERSALNSLRRRWVNMSHEPCERVRELVRKECEDVAAEMEAACALLATRCRSALNPTCNKHVFDSLWAIIQRSRVCLMVLFHPQEMDKTTMVFDALRALGKIEFLCPKLSEEHEKNC